MGNKTQKNLSDVNKQQIEVNSPFNFEPTQTPWQNEEDLLVKEMNILDNYYEIIQKKVKRKRKKLFKKIEIPYIPFKNIYDDIDHIIKSSNINIIFTQTKQCILEYITLILRIRKKLLTLYDTHLELVKKIDDKFKDSLVIRNKLQGLKEQIEKLMPFYQENDFLSKYQENNQDDIYTFILQKWVSEELDKS